MRICSRPQLVRQHWAPRLLFSMLNMTSQPGRPRMRVLPSNPPTITVRNGSRHAVAVVTRQLLRSMRSLCVILVVVKQDCGCSPGRRKRLCWSAIDSLLLSDERSLGILLTPAMHSRVFGTRYPIVQTLVVIPAIRTIRAAAICCTNAGDFQSVEERQLSTLRRS